MKIKKDGMRTIIIAGTGHEIWAYPDGTISIPAILDANSGDVQLIMEAIEIASKIAYSRIEL